MFDGGRVRWGYERVVWHRVDVLEEVGEDV